MVVHEEKDARLAQERGFEPILRSPISSSATLSADADDTLKRLEPLRLAQDMLLAGVSLRQYGNILMDGNRERVLDQRTLAKIVEALLIFMKNRCNLEGRRQKKQDSGGLAAASATSTFSSSRSATSSASVSALTPVLGVERMSKSSRAALAKALSDLSSGDLNAADQKLDTHELKSWPHLKVYQSLVTVTQKTYMDDGVKNFSEYLKYCFPKPSAQAAEDEVDTTVAAGDAAAVESRNFSGDDRTSTAAPMEALPFDPVALLVLSRIARFHKTTPAPALVLPAMALFESANPELANILLFESEKLEMHPERAELHGAGGGGRAKKKRFGSERKKKQAKTVEGRWVDLREQWGVQCESLDSLLQLQGLAEVKDQALLLYGQVQAEKDVPPEKRVPTSLNFTFLGNPGTGKTTVARIYGKVLYELRVREKDTFIETTGEELVREGADYAKDCIKNAMGGVLFIDEAHGLDPANSKEGRSIVTQLLTVAENKRTEISIIIAGYKDEIEDKLYGADPGFKSRFRTIPFDDFNNDELRSILVGNIKKQTWAIDDKRVVDVAARRIARGRGIKGFANARTVRTTFETAYSKALARLAGKKEYMFKTGESSPSPTFFLLKMSRHRRIGVNNLH